ncbi:hypothetical protein O181_080035 [Austropuccinia psidii MF-1]|uniref:Uncharacterized protein n=1 Tax=Austropuccinia psidii MF-1 TaxID=1389203 RepID=A0A9Q3FMH9_9BASI|nr:hypothetical protein [Austropuccinia psidii MF-1]
MAKIPIRPKLAMDYLWPIFHPTASSNHHRPPALINPASTQLKGKTVNSIMYPALQDPGVVHIWYYIPLFTNFAQKSNGDVCRTQFCDSKSSSQNPSPILKEESSAHQSGNPWRLSEDHSRTPTNWPCRGWVGNYFRIILREILRSYSSLNQL